MDDEIVPNRMFAVGHEPVGIRITAYHKSRGISAVINALDEDEVEVIRQSSFGKLISIMEKPSFSGRFARFMMSRQLKVNKRHEIWFLFAGKPIRVSLREFAIVTGLPCGEYPKKSKRKLKNMISENSNWGALFGSLKQISVKTVIKMLKNKTVQDKDIRLKYACLALLDSVILPTAHKHKIDPSHVEAIKDIREFFEYPWGRVAFEMMMSSIKERDEVALSQNTVAIKGFVHSLQLIMVEAVPALTSCVQMNSCSSSESEDDGDEVCEKENRPVKMSLNPSHARALHDAGEVIVDSIIRDECEPPIDESQVQLRDELDDVNVTNMVRLIERGYEFNQDMFSGGVTKADVERMRFEAKQKKEKKGKAPVSEGSGVADGIFASDVDVQQLGDSVARIVVQGFDDRLKVVDGQLDDLKKVIETIKVDISKEISEQFAQLEEKVVSRILKSFGKGSVVGNDESDQGAQCPPPLPRNLQDKDILHMEQDNNGSRHSISVGRETVIRDPIERSVGGGIRSKRAQLRQDESGNNVGLVNAGTGNSPMTRGSSNGRQDTGENEDEVDGTEVNCFGENISVGEMHNRKKQKKVDYGMKFAKLQEKLAGKLSISVCGTSLTSKEISTICSRNSSLSPKLIDVLMAHIREVFNKCTSEAEPHRVQFLDSKFVAMLVRNYAKFVKVQHKKQHKFQKTLLQWLCGGELQWLCGGDGPITMKDRFYFPFNFDRKHWVGICADVTRSSLFVLDCRTAIRSDNLIKQELKPIAALFPYALQQAYRSESSEELEEFAVVRVNGITQTTEHTDSGVASVLLMEAHAFAGEDVCKVFSPDVIEKETARLAVMMYEENCNEEL